MDFTSCWFRRCLVAFLGLILFSPVSFAQTIGHPPISYTLSFNTNAEALARCQSDLAATLAYWPTQGTPTNPINASPSYGCDYVEMDSPDSGGYVGYYICQVNLTRSSWEIDNVSNCRSSGPYNRFNPPGFVSAYKSKELPPEPPEPCEDLPTFTSPFQRPANTFASGNACSGGCAYSVKMISTGTFPVNNTLTWEWTSLGRECTEEDSDSTTEPFDPDNPLDLPPEDGGVDEPVDPGPGEDENGKGTSSGGGSCDSPPACSGDAIQCNILYQSWAGRCATQEGFANVGEGGIGDGAGEIVDAVDGVGGKIDGLGDKFDSAFGDSPIDTSGPIDGLSVGNVNIDASDLDDSGLSMSRTCPSVLTDSVDFSFFGNSYSLSFLPFCELLDLVGQLLVVLAAFVGVRILLGSVQ